MWQRAARKVSERFAYEGAFTMSEVQLNQVSSGRDKGEMEELKVRQICPVFEVPSSAPLLSLTMTGKPTL